MRQTVSKDYRAFDIVTKHERLILCIIQSYWFLISTNRLNSQHLKFTYLASNKTSLIKVTFQQADINREPTSLNTSILRSVLSLHKGKILIAFLTLLKQTKVLKRIYHESLTKFVKRLINTAGGGGLTIGQANFRF